jgi:hypothetical protein
VTIDKLESEAYIWFDARLVHWSGHEHTPAQLMHAFDLAAIYKGSGLVSKVMIQVTTAKGSEHAQLPECFQPLALSNT